MTKKLMIMSTLVIFVAIALAGCQKLGNISDTGNQFMTALKNQDYAASYALLTPDLQSELGGQDGWKTFAEPRNFEEWKVTNTQFENDQGQVDGEATLGNEIYNFNLVMQNVSDSWKVSGIDIQFKANK
jgi:hypothetical protein